MFREFTHLTTSNYQARLYPAQTQSAGKAKLGVCLSGGGSRALTCALGQLSALNSLPDPADPNNKTLLQRVDYLSSVSGGSWASVLFSFLPGEINGQPVSDDDFLITPVEPKNLIKAGEDDKDPANVSYMNEFCLGTAPQQFSIKRIAEVLYTLYEWGLFGDSRKWRWFWIAAVGEIILKPFDLYDALYDPNQPYIQPSRFFSLSGDHIKQDITHYNPSLGPSQFYTRRDDRPALFVNTNIMQDVTSAKSPQIPVQATPIDTGVLGQSPDGTIQGGGSVESFGFTSTLTGAGAAGTAAVTLDRRYSLCDIAGCSSAFFAALLLKYIDGAVDEIVDEVEAYLVKKGWHKWEAEIVGFALKLALDHFLNVDSSNLIPQYNYWTLDEVGQPDPMNTTYGFSDGGNFDNTGILGMLARTDVNTIIAFVNSETPLSKDASSGEVLVDAQLPLLFGCKGQPVSGVYESYGGMSPEEPLSYVQVFSEVKGAFTELREGLYNASCGGPGKDADLGTFTAAYTQNLTTVQNPVANIKENRSVTVIWVYNNRVNNWQNVIADSQIKTDLAKGQANQNSDGTRNHSGTIALPPLANFPYYDTGLQIELGKDAVNMLAQLSAWNVLQLQAEIAKHLA